MNYSTGLKKLREYLEQINDQESLELFTRLEKALQKNLDNNKTNLTTGDVTKIEKTINELDALSYRSIGVSFIELCSSKKDRPSLFRNYLSLRTILFLGVSFLLLLSFGVSLASFIEKSNTKQQIEQMKSTIEETDQSIEDGVTSFFYMSRVIPITNKDEFKLDPCSTEIYNEINIHEDLRITIVDYNLSTVGDMYDIDILCAWQYHDISKNVLLAKDYWQEEYKLIVREYFESNKLIARDFFTWDDKECFKRRSYIGINLEECYSEAGKIRTIRSDSALSPIPPVVYWFFYR